MPKIPRRLAATPVPTLRQQYLAVINSSTHYIFSLDPDTLSLTNYYWPVEGERRVTPDALRSYRKIQKFFGPCCLCPLLGTERGIERQFVEAAIYIPLFGRYKGEYVAECTKSQCGYLVPLERLYTKIGIPVKRYPQREAGEVEPPLCLHYSEICEKPRSLKRTYAQADLNNPPVFETTSKRRGGLDLGYETDWRRFNKLDTLQRPGVSEREFYGLFAKCDACNLVMTRLVFPNHCCRPLGEDGVELTDVDEVDED